MGSSWDEGIVIIEVREIHVPELSGGIVKNLLEKMCEHFVQNFSYLEEIILIKIPIQINHYFKYNDEEKYV